MNISCDRVRDLASGFVLGALDPAEMDAVREHMTSCAQPHPELREMGGVVSYLGGSLDPVEPRTNLRAAVMAAIQADLRSRSPERVAAVAEPVAVAEPQAPLVLTVLKPAHAAGVISLARVRGLRTRRAAVWITRAAAAFAIVSLVGYAVAVQSDLNRAHESQDHANTVYSYLQLPGARWAALTPQGGNKGVGDAVLLLSGHVAVWLHALQPTKGDEVYMVWLSSDSGPITKAGWFTVDDRGEGFLTMVNVSPSDSLWLMVCREPNSTVEKPTGPAIVTGTVWLYSVPEATPTR